jgi:hypothetical protein
MRKDPTSWYCWWVPDKDLNLRNINRMMRPNGLAPNWKQRLFWVGIAMLLVYVPLAIYIWKHLSRSLGH